MIDIAPPPKFPRPAIIRPRPAEIIRPGDPRFVVPEPLPANFSLTALTGFGAGGGDVPRTWQTAWSETVTSESGSTFASYTLVQVVPSSKIVLTGGVQVRVRFKSGSGGFAINKAYIGEGASSGDAYDFATTPTQLLFSGANGFTIGASTTRTSDNGISFSIPVGKNICVAWEQTASNYPQMYANPGGYTAGWNYKFTGTDSATVDKTGYAKYQDVGCIDLIEIYA